MSSFFVEDDDVLANTFGRKIPPVELIDEKNLFIPTPDLDRYFAGGDINPPSLVLPSSLVVDDYVPRHRADVDVDEQELTEPEVLDRGHRIVREFDMSLVQISQSGIAMDL